MSVSLWACEPVSGNFFPRKKRIWTCNRGCTYDRGYGYCIVFLEWLSRVFGDYFPTLYFLEIYCISEKMKYILHDGFFLVEIHLDWTICSTSHFFYWDPYVGDGLFNFPLYFMVTYLEFTIYFTLLFFGETYLTICRWLFFSQFWVHRYMREGFRFYCTSHFFNANLFVGDNLMHIPIFGLETYVKVNI